MFKSLGFEITLAGGRPSTKFAQREDTMHRKILALGLVASASAAGVAVPSSMRLRGGGFGALTGLPGSPPQLSLPVSTCALFRECVQVEQR